MTSIAPITAELKPAPTAKAKPKDQSVYIRAKHCEAKVAQRVKFYDTECTGFYVSVTPNGAATFNFRYTDRNTRKQRTVWLGVYEATEFSGRGRAHRSLSAQGARRSRRERSPRRRGWKKRRSPSRARPSTI